MIFRSPASLAGSMSKQDGKVFIGGLSWETTGRFGDLILAGSGLCFIIRWNLWVPSFYNYCYLKAHFIIAYVQMTSYVGISKTMEQYRYALSTDVLHHLKIPPL